MPRIVPIKINKAIKSLTSKGFNAKKRGRSKHSVFWLEDERGQDTGIKITMINKHSSGKDMVNVYIIKQWSSVLGIRDSYWTYGFVKCDYLHKDLMNKLREIREN
ncbi:MAG: hypothetical protein ACTSWY_13350 [Promethearchaeota archaeon]